MPDLSGVPEALHDAALLNLPLPALGEATKWQVEIAQDPQFTQVLRQGSFSAPMATWPVLADGLYQLRVRGVDAEGIPGYATQRPLRIKTRPIPPLAQSPAPGAILAQDQAELRCTEVPGVRWYHLQVAREEGFQDVQASAERQDECRLPLAGLALGRYYWRAASVQQLADGSADHGPFSPVQPFAIEARPAAVDAGTALDCAARTNIPAAAHTGSGRHARRCRRNPGAPSLVCPGAAPWYLLRAHPGQVRFRSAKRILATTKNQREPLGA